MDVPARRKAELFRRAIHMLREHFTTVNMSAHARALLARTICLFVHRSRPVQSSRSRGSVVCAGSLPWCSWMAPRWTCRCSLTWRRLSTIEGPTAEGHMIDETVGLHHKRLAIIDLTTGQQPMTSVRSTVVFNGEIYNYVELRDELKRRGRRVPDAVRHGSHPRHVRGARRGLPFWRSTGCSRSCCTIGTVAVLIAARDHFGIKPLYYRADDRRVAVRLRDQGVAAAPGHRVGRRTTMRCATT